MKPFLSSHFVDIARALSSTGSLTFPSPASNGPDSQVTSLKEVHQHTITGVITQLEVEDPRKAAFVRSGMTQPEQKMTMLKEILKTTLHTIQK